MTLRERIREYWDRKPCNSWWPEVGWNYTEHKKLVEPHIWEWSQFPTWEGKRVLDLGCGIGTMSLEFAKAGAEVWALDMSPQSLNIAMERGRDYPNLHFVLEDAEGFNLDPVVPALLPKDVPAQESFDLVYSFGVLHHTPDPLKALRRAYYHLYPDGQLYIMMYHRWGWKRIIRGRPEAQSGCPLVTYWTPKSVTKLLREAGFEPYDFQVRHIFPYVGKLYGQGIFKVAFPWSVLPGWMYRWAERHLGQHLLVKARKA